MVVLTNRSIKSRRKMTSSIAWKETLSCPYCKKRGLYIYTETCCKTTKVYFCKNCDTYIPSHVVNRKDKRQRKMNETSEAKCAANYRDQRKWYFDESCPRCGFDKVIVQWIVDGDENNWVCYKCREKMVQDETDYLLSSPENKRVLQEALEEAQTEGCSLEAALNMQAEKTSDEPGIIN